jgi:cation:H+ antiporter
MSVLVDFLFFVMGLFILVVAATYMVQFLSKIAVFLRINEFIISFVLVGVSTSLPELFVGITSAWTGNPSLSLGNLIGANIADLTIVIGIPILLARGIPIETKAAHQDVYYMLVIAALPLVLMSIGNELSRIDGVILVFAFCFYIYKIIQQQRLQHRVLEEHITHKQVVLDMFLFFICFSFVLLGAHYVVKHATAIAVALDMPLIMIGLLLLALGTSTPEMTFNIRSVRQGHPEMALGDVVGSIVTNSTLIMGIVAIIHPIKEAVFVYFTSWVFLLLVCFIFMTFVKGATRLTWREGVALILLYCFFLMVEFYVKGVVKVT